MDYSQCTEECELMPECLICHKVKKPRGRAAPLHSENGYCGPDCPGYYESPTSGHLWPGELAELRDGEPEE